MQNLVHRLARHLGDAITAVEPKAISAADSGAKSRESGRKVVITAIGVGYVALAGAAELLLPRGLDFDLFFLLGCVGVGWSAGAAPAVMLAAVCGTVASLCGRGAGSPGLPWAVEGWNWLIKISLFATSGWLAAKAGGLKRRLQISLHEGAERLRIETEEHQQTATRLRESSDLFRQVTENITEVFWVTDPAKTRVNYVSLGFERVWGQPRQALYTNPGVWLAAVCDEDRERVSQATYTRQITGDYDEEFRIQRPDGSICWIHDRAFPVLNERGQVYRVVGIAEDISRQKRAEQLLEAQRDLAVALSITSDLGLALNRLLDMVIQLEGIDCGGVYLINENTGALDLEAQLGLPAGFASQVATYAPDSREVLLLKEGQPRYPICASGWNTENAFWFGDGLRALAVLPLQHEGRALGVLNLGSHEQDEIPPGSRVALETIATQAAGAIARLRLEPRVGRTQTFGGGLKRL